MRLLYPNLKDRDLVIQIFSYELIKYRDLPGYKHFKTIVLYLSSVNSSDCGTTKNSKRNIVLLG